MTTALFVALLSGMCFSQQADSSFSQPSTKTTTRSTTYIQRPSIGCQPGRKSARFKRSRVRAKSQLAACSPGNDLKNFPLTGEGVNRVGGNEGHINSSNENTVGAAAHDVLHFAGMQDKYVGSFLDSKGERVGSPLPGYDSNIMADRSGTDLKVSQFQEAERNRTTKHCEVADGKTTCN